MKLPSPTEQLLRAVKFLERGIARWRVQTCPTCGKRNRVDIWRLLWMSIGSTARCGSCKTELGRTTKK